MNMKFLEKMLSAMSVSGDEEPVQKIVEEEMNIYADQIIKDEMNNLTCVLNRTSSTRVMLSAHADEIGLIVSNITEQGMLQAIVRGGIIPSTYPGQTVQIQGRNGLIYGVVQAYRDLFTCKDLSAKDFVIDIGARTKEEVQKAVALGAPIVQDRQMRKLLNKRVAARAFDDRIGVFIIMEALKRAKERGSKAGIYAASTTGEETTKTGAYWTSARIKPDMAIVVDVTYTSDCLGMNPAEMGTVELGKGPVLCNSPIVAKRLNKRMEESAEKAGVKIQWEAASGLSYTDGDRIHFSGEGVPIVLISVPLRYMHMPGEVADLSDVEGCIELIAEFLCSCQS